MNKPELTVAQEIANAARHFQLKRTGHAPTTVTVVLSDGTMVVTLHDALSPAEKTMSQNPEGAAQVQQFHRELFRSSVKELSQEIQRITGIAVREAVAEVEPATGAIVHAFTTGAMVQVFLLAKDMSTDDWNGPGPGDQPNKESIPCS